MKNVLIIIPTYNESENISPIIKKIFSINPSWHILVVDDNSPDGTGERVKDLQKIYSNLHILTRPKKMGLGSAYVKGFKYALDQESNLIVQIDADFSHSPEDIPQLIELTKEFDLVIGSRYVPGGATPNWNLFRRLLSKTANIYTGILIGIPVKDSTSGFKCIKAEILKKLDLASIRATGFAFQIEMTFWAYQNHAKIKEHPITFINRVKDKSKMSLTIIAEAFIRVIGLALQKRMRA